MKEANLQPSVNFTDIIVADDDPMIRSVLRASFEALNLNVFLAHDGVEAVKLALQIAASLIILDLRMPQLNGLLACQRIRQLPNHATTPIVILTSTSGKDAEAAASRVGATDYFVKPFRPALLLQAMSRFLPINAATRDLIRQSADRVSRITESAPKAGGTVSSATPGSDLERGRHILDVLRG
jgi:CheY-like chemotaxis protein